MKRAFVLLSLFALLCLGAGSEPVKLVRLTLINKSGFPMEYKLTGTETETIYYLRMPIGDRTAPSEKTFTIEQGIYRFEPYYVELWDPVYGNTCGSSGGQTLYALRNIRIVFLECGRRVRSTGEPSMLKYPSRWKFIY